MPSIKPGRNDPCLCGSDKKYKNCCLANERQRSESPNDVVWARVRRAIDGIPTLLGNFVTEVYGAKAIVEAWTEFTLRGGYELGADVRMMGIFMPWLYHRWDTDPQDDKSILPHDLRGRAPTAVFLERRARRLDPLVVRYLEACVAAPFSFHEILRCEPGHGFRARDVLTGEEQEVLESSASQSMTAGDILFGQLVPIEGIVLLEACSPYPLSPIDKIRIIELREDLEEVGFREPDDPPAMWDVDIRDLYFKLIERFLDPRPPELQNTDGEPLKLQRMSFDLDDAERALAVLASGENDADVERTADGRLERARFSWTRPGNRLHASWENTILGNIEITSTRLVAHVNSDGRAAALREFVEKRLGSAARYRGSEAVELPGPDAGEELEAGSRDDGAPQDLAELPEVREHLSRMLEKHYENWVTQKLPALGNRRPIDVVGERNGREKVEALVLEMERGAARMSPGGVGEAAIARVRERLGLARR